MVSSVHSVTEARHRPALGAPLIALCIVAGCAGSHHREATTPGEDPLASFDDAGFLEGCRDGCAADGGLCSRFCECSLAEIHRSPELAQAVESAGSLDADPAAVEAMQTRFLTACGDEFYAHHFVEGCREDCVAEGIASAACAERCTCLYSEIRRRHPGPDGLAHMSRVYATDRLPPEAEEEIHSVGPDCGF